MKQPDANSEKEDDCEYEYDEVDTETFFVDIDLSSLNPGPRPNHHAPSVPKRVTPAKRKIDDSTTHTPEPDEPSLDNAGYPSEEARATPMQESQGTHAGVAERDQDALLPFPSRVQILELNSVNPIVSYQGQVFSCIWSDMVGTNMFFTHPEMTDAAGALRSTDDYDLIGMSRIKLVGHRAKITTKPTKATEADVDFANEHSTDSNDAPGGQHTEFQIREKQASFLEKLREIKQRRGETDVVRTHSNHENAPAEQEKVHESDQGQAVSERV